MLINIIIAILLLILFWLAFYSYRLNKRLYEIEKEFDRRVAEESNKLAQKMYSEWVSTKLREIEKQLEEKFRVEFEKHKERWEREIRRDAIERSVSVILGKISEHIAPLLLAERLNVNPKDLRFLETPIDYVAFKGLSDGKPEEIIFIEVKASKTGALTSKELAVKKLVEDKKVRWITFNLYDIVEEARRLATREAESIAAKQKSEVEKVLKDLLEKLGKKTTV